VAVEILRLTGQPKVDLAELKKCLLRDPALVGKIFRVVNSSLYGLNRSTSDLNQALNLLGIKSVRLLVLGFSLPPALFEGLTGEVLKRYWHRAILKATAAREISESIYHQPGEEAFIAGLLQDLGVLVLIGQLGEHYVRFLDRTATNEIDLNTAEGVALGFEHAQLTGRLLAKWGLPEKLVTAIEVGNSRERIEKLPPSEQRFPQILHMADLLAGMLTERRASLLRELLKVGREYCQTSTTKLSPLIVVLQTKVRELADVMSVELPEDQNYESIFAEAHRQLSAAAEDAAMELATGRQALPPRADDEISILEETRKLSEAVRSMSMERNMTTANRPSVATMIGENQRQTTLPARSDSRIASAASAGPTTMEPREAREMNDLSQWSPAADAFTTSSPQLDDCLRDSIAACRQQRCSLSLILVAIDRFDDIRRTDSNAASRAIQLFRLVCGKVWHRPMEIVQAAEDTLGLVLENCDRSAAIEVGHFVLTEVRQLRSDSDERGPAKLSISVGVASAPMLPKNFSPLALFESADRCLNAAKLSGGNRMKSIDVL
jgi:HD-like signal output (HDOD) protein/GGDEF domain-containing protein